MYNKIMLFDIELINTEQGRNLLSSMESLFSQGEKEFVEDAADIAYRSLQRHVPLGYTGRTYGAIFKTKATISETGGYEARAGVGEVKNVKPGEDPKYPKYVHEGTGIYGPKHDLIFAAHGNLMVFDIPGKGTFYRAFVRGQKAQPYLEKVKEETLAWVKLHKRQIFQILEARNR